MLYDILTLARIWLKVGGKYMRVGVNFFISLLNLARYHDSSIMVLKSGSSILISFNLVYIVNIMQLCLLNAAS